MPVTNEAPNVRFLHRFQSSAIRTHGRTTARRLEQHVCRKITAENSRGWARIFLFSSTQTASADQLSVHRDERQSGKKTLLFICAAHYLPLFLSHQTSTLRNARSQSEFHMFSDLPVRITLSRHCLRHLNFEVMERSELSCLLLSSHNIRCVSAVPLVSSRRCAMSCFAMSCLSNRNTVVSKVPPLS